MAHVIKTEQLATALGLQTNAARTALAHRLTQWHDPATLQAKSHTAAALQRIVQQPTVYQELRSHITAIAALEPALSTPPTALERESYGELLFLRPFLQPLNALPFVLPLWSLLRIYLLPGLSFLLPLLALLAPYVILTYVLCVPITFRNYVEILHSMISGQLACDPTALPLSSTSATASASPAPAPHSLLKQLAVIGMTLLQGIIQPYWSYQHLHAIDQTMEAYGRQWIELKTRYEILYERLKEHGYTYHPCPLPDYLSPAHAAAEALLHPAYGQLALTYLGQLEVHLELYHLDNVHPVQWVKGEPVFDLRDAYDLHLPPEHRVPLSLRLEGDKRHALLTGPNKGGKSTVLRALALSALLAHTFGCSIGHLTATPFDALCVCLQPDDLPGSKSRFEREIEFTASTLRHKGPVLVFLDELFHSTNPPDALASSVHYTKQLWALPTAVSVISTHLFDWVREAPPSIQRLCCPATATESGIEFSYRLAEGVCTVSSVQSILRENGL